MERELSSAEHKGLKVALASMERIKDFDQPFTLVISETGRFGLTAVIEDQEIHIPVDWLNDRGESFSLHPELILSVCESEIRHEMFHLQGHHHTPEMMNLSISYIRNVITPRYAKDSLERLHDNQ